SAPKRRTGRFSFWGASMSLIPYTKPHLSITDQLALLTHRGMAVSDVTLAAECLERFGYYRLSGYWYPMRDSVTRASPDGVEVEVIDRFREGVEFKPAVDLCVFDKRLRMLMTDAIERIEVALRVDVAHLLGARDPWAHLGKAELDGKFTSRVADLASG